MAMTVAEARDEIINRLRCLGILHTDAPWAVGLIDPVLEQLVGDQPAKQEGDVGQEARTAKS